MSDKEALRKITAMLNDYVNNPKEGLLNPKVGTKYVDKVLSKGGSEDEMSQIKSFLGREPKQEAFLKSLGL